MVSEGVRYIKAQQSRGHLVSQQISLTSHFGNCYCGVQSDCSRTRTASHRQLSVLGVTLGFCFVHLNIMITHLVCHVCVCPHLSGEHHCN